MPLYAHKIVKFSEAFEEDANLLLDRFLCVLAFPLPNYITGLPMDLVHGFGTLIFLMIAAEPMLEKMDRIKIKYGIAE